MNVKTKFLTKNATVFSILMILNKCDQNFPGKNYQNHKISNVETEFLTKTGFQIKNISFRTWRQVDDFYGIWYIVRYWRKEVDDFCAVIPDEMQFLVARKSTCFWCNVN